MSSHWPADRAPFRVSRHADFRHEHHLPLGIGVHILAWPDADLLTIPLIKVHHSLRTALHALVVSKCHCDGENNSSRCESKAPDVVEGAVSAAVWSSKSTA
jgi:hypothetical protein